MPPDASVANDAPEPTEMCDPAADSDGDCIPDGVEGCAQSPPADRDRDSVPNHIDIDSDNDGIPDRIEVGANCSLPRDSDRDTLPNYLDEDSDNDGVQDRYEDRNGDGMLGSCSTACSMQTACAATEYCSLPISGAGSGICVSATCLGDETDPHNPDTDGDGAPDNQEGTVICNPRTPDNPNGLKRVVYADSSETPYAKANWRIALELEAITMTPVIVDSSDLDSVFGFDLTASTTEVAGFLVSRPAALSSAVDEANSAIGALGKLSLVAAAGIDVRVSGSPTKSLDGFDTVVGTTLELRTGAFTDVTGLRAALLPALLDGEINAFEAGWSGAMDNEFIVVYQTVYRAETEQTLYVGAVARRSAYDDRTRATAFHADDISNGTGHSVSGNPEALECEPYVVDEATAADIIWVVDESNSMDDDRQNIANLANDFFGRAVESGLDFRMGVTDMNDSRNGVFATAHAGGTGDRWLTPDEAGIFADNIIDPSGGGPPDQGEEHGLTQGFAALDLHLPRDNNDPQKVREHAKLIVIYVTDEKPDEIEEQLSIPTGNHEPSSTQQNQINQFLAPYIAQLADNEAIAHLIAEPLPFEAETCSALGEHAYGYYELVAALGGQIGSVCQSDLGATIDAIIDSIVGASSPVVLSRFPISASLAVARDNKPVPRSRVNGWDYRGASNSIVFFKMPFDPDNPSDVIVSYRRWDEQFVVE